MAGQVTTEQVARVYAAARLHGSAAASHAPTLVQLDASEELITAVSALAAEAGLSGAAVFDLADQMVRRSEDAAAGIGSPP